MTKIYSASYAKQLIRNGKAREVGTCTNNGARYAVIELIQSQQTAHYKLPTTK